MSHCLRVFMWLVVLSTPFSAALGFADKIYLKDGSIEVSERVWQSDKYIHFILKGTTDVTIRYAKTIVDRVLIDGVEVPIAVPAADAKKDVPAPVQAGGSIFQKETPAQPKVTEDQPAAPAEKQSAIRKKPAIQSNTTDQKRAAKHKGISFYDPRRDMRYWASRQSKHSTLSAALAALAKMYGQSVSWVETYMGEENDLGVIHQNLMMNQGQRETMARDETKVHKPYYGQFYNPGQKQPFRIGPNKLFKNQAAAVKALAQQYGRSIAWVQDNFGQSNELATIHDNLKAALQKTATPKKEETVAVAPIEKTPAKGNTFYNPRRKKKYWIGGSERYNSLDDALGALAKKYGVTVELIERHMGNTNDLAQIHQNLRTNLE